MKKTMAALSVAAALGAGPLSASDKPYYRDVKGRVELAQASLASFGWRLDQAYTGTLSAGEGGFAKLKLAPGREYRIVGRCDDECTGLDLVLARDEQPIERDLDGDKRPSVDFQPRFTGNFSAVTRMVGCESTTCRYGVAVFSR